MKLYFFDVKSAWYETKENEELGMEEVCKKCNGSGLEPHEEEEKPIICSYCSSEGVLGFYGDVKEFIKSYYKQHDYRVIDSLKYARMDHKLRDEFPKRFGVSKKQFIVDLNSKGRPDFLVYTDKEIFFVVATSLSTVSAYRLKWVFSKSYPSKIVILQDTESVRKEKAARELTESRVDREYSLNACYLPADLDSISQRQKEIPRFEIDIRIPKSQPKSTEEEIRNVLNIVKELEKKYESVEVSKVVKEARKYNLSEARTRWIVDEMLRKTGDIYEPKRWYVKVVRPEHRTQ